MSKDKNLQRKNRRWLSSRRPTPYGLELLESRVLLSADLAAAAAQFKPEMVTEALQQAVVLNTTEVPAAKATSQAEASQMVESLRAQVPASTNATVAQPTGSSPQLATEFGRLFPNLPAFAMDTPAVHAALLELGKAGGLLDAGDDLSDPKTLITDPLKSINNPDNPAMAAGMTFLGQFLDHDLTFDQTSILGQAQDPALVSNARTPAFDLDSVYGGGTKLSPQLYDQSAEGKRNQVSDRRDPWVGITVPGRGRSL